MKKLLAFLCISIFAGNLFSQIPNNSFEAWGTTDPVNWVTTNNNTGAVINVTQSGTAHAGTSAMRMETWTYMGYTFASIAANPDQNNLFPYVGQPQCLNGWYIGNFVSSDYLSVLTDLRLNGTSTGAGSLNINTNTATYMAFSVPFIYQNQVNSDSAVITFSLSSGGAFGNAGSFVIIDDLQYGNCMAGLNNEILSAKIQDIYPNPASGQLNFNYVIMVPAMVSIDLVTIDGKPVHHFLKAERSSGTYQENFDLSNIAAGNYFIQLTSNNKKLVEKLVIQ
jgi:hypothetical protein